MDNVLMFPVNLSNVFRLIVATFVPVVMQGRILIENGNQIKHIPFSYSSADALTNLVNGSKNTKEFPALFANGDKVVSVIVRLETAGIESGDCYITADVLERHNDQTPMKQLLGCYLTSSVPVSYPETPIADSLSGPGASKIHTVAINSFNFTVPINSQILLEHYYSHTEPETYGNSIFEFYIRRAGVYIFNLHDYKMAGDEVYPWYINLFQYSSYARYYIASDLIMQSYGSLPSFKLIAGDYISGGFSDASVFITQSLHYRKWIDF